MVGRREGKTRAASDARRDSSRWTWKRPSGPVVEWATVTAARPPETSARAFPARLRTDVSRAAAGPLRVSRRRPLSAEIADVRGWDVTVPASWRTDKTKGLLVD